MRTPTPVGHDNPARIPARRLRRSLAIGLLAAVLAPAIAADPPTDTERNRQFIDAAFARWAAGGSGFFQEVLHEDVVWTIKGSGPSAGVHRGRQAFVEKAVRPFAARMEKPVRPVSRQVWAQGEHVIVQWEGEGVAADRAPYRNSYVWILRMRGGRATEVTAYLDLAPTDHGPASGACRAISAAIQSMNTRTRALRWRFGA